MENRDLYQYEIVKKLSFVRYGGTEQELKAARMIQQEIAALGGQSQLMDFQIPAYQMETCRLSVTAPFCREIPCQGNGRSGQLPEGGMDLDLRYVEMNSQAAFLGMDDLSGCAVLVNTLDLELYQELVNRKAAVILSIAQEKWYNTPATTDLIARPLRDTMLALGQIPTVTIRPSDAMEMVLDGAAKVHVELRQQECSNTSRNVIAEIPGTGKDWVVLTAHYDSVTVGTGSWDNATGSANLLYIYDHFLRNPPKCSMRFIWCGSEEQGLLGSKAYVAQNPEALESIRFCFNFDMCGTILGSNHIAITGAESIKTICQQICDEAGYAASFEMGVHSSDSAPFCDHGIPAIGSSRYARCGEIHTRNDLLPLLSPAQLVKNGDFAIFLISRFVNSAVFPVKREMPDEMKKELDKYFKRTKKEA